jgi:hypothetical protein
MQMSRWFRSGRTAPLLLTLLAACGGGGGGSEPSPELTVHFATDQLDARYFHGQHYLTNTYLAPVSLIATGTVDPVPQGPAYVQIVLDAPVFEGDVGFDASPPNSFSLTFRPLTGLAVGTYTGTIELKVFQDAAMTRPYRVAGGTLDYALTVDPELTISVKIDGVTQSESFSSSHFAVTDYNPGGYGTIYWRDTTPGASFTLHPGQLVELEASVPVTWYGPDQTAGPYGSWFDPPVVNGTTLSQTIPEPQVGSGLTGSSFIAMPVAPGQFGAGFVFDLAVP